MDMGTQMQRERRKEQTYPMPWTPFTHWAEKLGIFRPVARICLVP